MWLVRAAMRRPWTVLTIVIGVALCSILAFRRMRMDIFPDLNLPVIYVAQPYGGMSPAQMEGYLTYYYEYHFLYINGIQSVESKSIQGAALLKLTFHPGTDMSQALAQTISYVNRAHAFMPYGTVPPFIIRFDAGTVPVGYLVFSSRTRDLGQIQDLALNRVRPVFATLPGVSAPPPFGGNQRTIVVTVDPDRLRAYGMSPEEVVKAVNSGNVIMPAGNMQTGTVQRMVPVNSVVQNIADLLDLPIRAGSGPAVYLRDVGKVQDSTDLLAGYALVNGKRAVYIPVTKRPDASTLAVVDEVRESLPRFRSLIPEDISITYEFDQSGYVKGALGSVSREALLGALLTGLMVLLFLADWRSSLIVVATIPFALLTAVVVLWALGQTINIMTLGGLALAVGILVDEGTVVIENIHTHLSKGKNRARAVMDASREVAVPRLLAMLCVLAVFVPSFFMEGVARALFVPLALAVGFAMAASYFLSSSLVPVLSTWIIRAHSRSESIGRFSFERFRERCMRVLETLLPRRGVVVAGYLVASALVMTVLGPRLGRGLFPAASADQFLLRFRAPTGTRVVETERLVLGVLDQIQRVVGPENVEITLGYVGTQGASYPINTVFLWTSGPQDAVMRLAFRPEAHIDVQRLEEELRKRLPALFPGSQFSFEAGDIVSQIMNFGSPTPVEVVIRGPNLNDDRQFAQRIRSELAQVSSLRDLQYEQPLDYPSLDVNVNRTLAGQLGVTVEQVGRSVVAATSSSRFVTPSYWRDPNSGVGYQVQVEIPQPRMTTPEDIAAVPVSASSAHPLLGDLATISYGTVVGEYDRENGQRLVSLAANTADADLGRTAAAINQALNRAGTPPRGITVAVRGQIAPMQETLRNLGIGLLLAIVVIFLLLVANFESVRLALLVISTIPAVICGVIVFLLITRTTLNIQSFMGAIMAIGVAIANAILLITFAEQYRRMGREAAQAAADAVRTRLRPVLMTSLAMIAGMLPMALALGTGAEEAAPLGRAVIGGLMAATFTTIFILPSVFIVIQASAGKGSPSLDPDDPESSYIDTPLATGEEPS